jgi:hypothetical protein
MSHMLAMVTHLAQGNQAGKRLQVGGIILAPDFMTVQRRIASMADAAAIAIVPVGQATQSIPLLLCEQVAQVVSPGCAGDEFNSEPQIHGSTE